MPDNDKTSAIVAASMAARSRTARAIPSESFVKARLCGCAAVICSARMHRCNAAVSCPSGMQIARKNAKRPVILAIGADDLETERKTVFAEPGRQRQCGRAQQGPGRTVFGIAGIAQAFGRFAERRQRQHGVEAR